MAYSIDGYKRNSKDVNNPYNVIPSGDITMKGVDFPVMGTDNLGNQQLMQPGFDYQFPGSQVFEQPMQNPTQDTPKNEVKKRRVDRDNKLIKNWIPEMGDVSSHLMTSMQFTDDDGSPIYVVIPTLFPTIEGQETPDPASWTQFAKGDEMSAFEMAMTRGEVYYFNSAEEANKFSRGSWKTPNLKKRTGGSLPKAQWWNIFKNARNIFKPSSIPKNIRAVDILKKKYPLLLRRDYKSFNDWDRYISANQSINTNFQLPSLLSGDMLNLTNNKNQINTNILSSYIDKTKGLNSVQLYDRQKMKTVFDDLNLGSEKFVDKDLFIGEVGKTINPQLIIPSITSLPMRSNTIHSAYWPGADSPFKPSFKDGTDANSILPTNWGNMNYTNQQKWLKENHPELIGKIVDQYTDPHVLQTFIPESKMVPNFDRSTAAGHFSPIEGANKPDGGLTLGHNRVAFDPAYPKTTISIERQSDYAQKYNKNLPGHIESLKKDQEPITTEVTDDHIRIKDGITQGDDWIKNILQEEALEHWTSRSLHSMIKDYYNGSSYPGNTVNKPLVYINELSHDKLLEIANTSHFRNSLDKKIEGLKEMDITREANRVENNLSNQKQLYLHNYPNKLSTDLKDFRKNTPTILLNELIDYSTKLGNTHVHLPLTETVAKTQGYDANKWGAPNPLYTEHKWTGHDWNEFNSSIENQMEATYRGWKNANESIGPFSFKVKHYGDRPKDVITIYKHPETGEVTELLGESSEQQKQIQTLRNEFLTSKGYNPEVDYRGDVGSYPEKRQTILNKATEKQLKKDIEQVFGKDYPYEIITDARGNKYIRLDHTGTRLPIQNLHTYKYGGSLTKYQDSGQLPKAQIGKGLRWLMSPFSKRARAAHYKDLLKTKPTNFDVRGMNEASINFNPTKTFVPELNLSGANLGKLTNFEKFQLNKQLSTAVDNPEFSYLLQNYGLLNTSEYATRLGDFAANNPDSRIGLNIGNSLRIPKGGIRLNDGTHLGQNLSHPGVSGTYNESIANEMYENQVAEVLNKGFVPNNMMQTFQGKTTHQFNPDIYGTEFYAAPGWGYPTFGGGEGGLVYAGKTEKEVRRNLLDNYFEYTKPEYNKSLLTSITNNPNLVDISDKQSLLDANKDYSGWDYLSSEKTKNLESYGGTGLLFQNIGGKDFMVNKGLMNPDPLSNITSYVNRSRDFTGNQHNYMLFQGKPDLVISGSKGYVGPSGGREYTTGLPNPQANTEVPIQNKPMYNYLKQEFELNKPFPGTFIRYKDGGSLPKAQWWNPSKAYNTVKNIISLNKYNRSKDVFGNTGKMLSNDITPSLLKNRSLIDYKGLRNTTFNNDRLNQLMAEYTIDSSPFKFGTNLGTDGSSLPLSVIRGPNGEIINATGNEYALELSNFINNNKLQWKNNSNSDKPLSLTRMWNENQSLSGTHGNINDLKLSLNSGEPIQLGDITSWSAGKAGLNAFGEHRYVIKDFDFEKPALLNEYNKYLSKNQQNVWKEREILLSPDAKFKVNNIIENAPRKPGWDLFTNLKESNPKLWEELNLDFGSTNKAGGYGFTNNPTDKIWPTGQTNPNYEKIQTLIQNDPSFKIKATPNYGTDVELELLKKYGGSLPKFQGLNKSETEPLYNAGTLPTVNVNGGNPVIAGVYDAQNKFLTHPITRYTAALMGIPFFGGSGVMALDEMGAGLTGLSHILGFDMYTGEERANRKKYGGSLPKHQVPKLVQGTLNLANRGNKSVNLINKIKPQKYVTDLINVGNRTNLINQYNVRNDMYRTVNMDHNVINNEALRLNAEKFGFNPNDVSSFAAYMGTTPTGGFGRRSGYEEIMNQNKDILYTGNYPHVTNYRYTTGQPKNAWTVKSNIWEDDISLLSDQQIYDRISLLDKSWTHAPEQGIFNVGANLSNQAKLNATPHGSLINTQTIHVPQLTQTNLLLGTKYQPVRKPISLFRGDDLNKSLQLSENKFDTFQQGGDLPKAQWQKKAWDAYKGIKNYFSPGIKPMNVRKVGDFGKPRSQYIFQAPHGDRVQSLKNYYNPDFTKFSELRTHPNVGDYTYDKMIDEFIWLNNAAKVSDRVIKPYNPIYNNNGDLISYDMPNLRDYVSAGYVVNNKTLFELDPIFGENLTAEVSKLNASGFIHGDLHADNIMVKLNASKNKILDFKIIDPTGFPQLTPDINYKTAPFLQFRQKSWDIDKTDNPLFQRMNVLNKASDIDKKKLIELENKKPIKFNTNLSEYQQGGSLPKAQWWNVFKGAKNIFRPVPKSVTTPLYTPPSTVKGYLKTKQLQPYEIGDMNQISLNNYLIDNGSYANKFLPLTPGADLASNLSRNALSNFSQERNALVDFNAPRGTNFGTSIYQDQSTFSPLLRDHVKGNLDDIIKGTPFIGLNSPMRLQEFTSDFSQVGDILNTRNSLVARIKTPEGRLRIKENYLGPGATDADVNKFIATVEQTPILKGNNDWYFRPKRSASLRSGELPFVKMDPNMPVNYGKNIMRHEDEHLLQYVSDLMLNPSQISGMNSPQYLNTSPIVNQAHNAFAPRKKFGLFNEFSDISLFNNQVGDAITWVPETSSILNSGGLMNSYNKTRGYTPIQNWRGEDQKKLDDAIANVKTIEKNLKLAKKDPKLLIDKSTPGVTIETLADNQMLIDAQIEVKVLQDEKAASTAIGQDTKQIADYMRGTGKNEQTAWSEPTAHIAELQQFMLDNKFLDDAYQTVTPDMIKNIRTQYADKVNMGQGYEGYPLRILLGTKNTTGNNKIISKLLNKMLTGAALTGAAFSELEWEEELEEKKYGGSLPKAQWGLSDMWTDLKTSLNPYNYYSEGSVDPLNVLSNMMKGGYEKMPTYYQDDKDDAFKKARKELGPGQLFLHDGTRYKTDYAGETEHIGSNYFMANMEQAIKDGKIEQDVYDRWKEIWTELGQPDLEMGTDKYDNFLAAHSWDELGLDQSDHVNPVTDKLWIQTYKTKYPKHWMDAVIEELTHIKQQREMGRGKYMRTYVQDLIGTLGDQGDLYRKEGTLENEAHNKEHSHSNILNDYIYKGIRESDKKQYGGSLPKAQIQDEIIDANKLVDTWSKKYHQSDNFKSLARGYDIPQNVIDERVESVMNFNPDTDITFDPNANAAGMTYYSGTSNPDGTIIPTMGPFTPEGNDMVNYNVEKGPPFHPMYQTWEDLAAHEVAGHIGMLDEDSFGKEMKKILRKLGRQSVNMFLPSRKELDMSRSDYREMKNHMKDNLEMRANLMQLRYKLAKEGLYDSTIGTAEGGDGTNPFTDKHLLEMYEETEGGWGPKEDWKRNELLQFLHPQDLKWMMNNVAQKDDPAMQDLTMAKMGKELGVYQKKGETEPNWLARRLYNSVTPIGYNLDQATKEMLYGSRQPFEWGGVETNFDDLQNHPMVIGENALFEGYGDYIKNASMDLWGKYLGFDQKHNTISNSKFKPTIDVEDTDATYYSFNDVRDIWDDIIDRDLLEITPNSGTQDDIAEDKWQIDNSSAGGMNLRNYQISKGEDEVRRLPYFSYYDEYDFDIPTGLGFDIKGESIVGDPFEIYGRIYYDNKTGKMIPEKELDGWWVNENELKQGISYAESLNGELMINPESTATGLYGQRFSEIDDMYDGTREEFALDTDAQNDIFRKRYEGEMEGIPSMRQSGIDLYQEYKPQIENFPYSTTEVAALVNFLGRQGTREYLGYVLRDGNTLEAIFPTKYGSGANQANKTPQQYIEKFNEGIINKKMGGEINDLTDRLIKKLEDGGKLTPAGTKHLQSLGMI